MPPLTFDQWMKEVDSELMKLCNYGIDVFKDYNYKLSYSRNENPRDVAHKILNNSGLEWSIY